MLPAAHQPFDQGYCPAAEHFNRKCWYEPSPNQAETRSRSNT